MLSCFFYPDGLRVDDRSFDMLTYDFTRTDFELTIDVIIVDVAEWPQHSIDFIHGLLDPLKSVPCGISDYMIKKKQRH